jgi:hypothetical protein
MNNGFVFAGNKKNKQRTVSYFFNEKNSWFEITDQDITLSSKVVIRKFFIRFKRIHSKA